MADVKNVVLITVDCLRPDHLPTYGYDRETAPFIEKVGSEAAVFENAFATGSGTSVSFPSILSGTYPFDYGGYNGLSTERIPLARLLKNHDIATAGVHSNTFLTEHYGYDRGFDRYESFSHGGSGGGLGSYVERILPSPIFDAVRDAVWKYRSLRDSDLSLPYVPADRTTDRAIEMLDELNETFFLWVHYLDPHEPHKPPTRIHSEFAETGPSWQALNVDWKRAKKPGKEPDPASVDQFVDAYDAEVRFVDENIERLYDALNQRGLGDNTQKIITADHGEEFMDHGDVSHLPKLYDELIRVPLIIDDPKRSSSEWVEELVSLVDLPVSILRTFDIEPPTSYRGKPIQDIITDAQASGRNHVFGEVCHEWGDGVETGKFDREKMIITCRTREHKYILDNQAGTEEFYNVREDPEESEEGIGVPAEIKDSLRKAVSDHLIELHQAGNEPSSRDVPDDVENRMRDLGYVE